MPDSPSSYTEVFEESLPYYLSIGMTWEQYWEGDPYLTVAYRAAHLLNVEQRNQELWLQGLYVHQAFAVVLSNAFGKKGAKKQKYPEEPYRITPLSEREKAAKAAKEREKLIAQLNHWERAWREKQRVKGGA